MGYRFIEEVHTGDINVGVDTIFIDCIEPMRRGNYFVCSLQAWLVEETDFYLTQAWTWSEDSEVTRGGAVKNECKRVIFVPNVAQKIQTAHHFGYLNEFYKLTMKPKLNKIRREDLKDMGDNRSVAASKNEWFWLYYSLRGWPGEKRAGGQRVWCVEHGRAMCMG